MEHSSQQVKTWYRCYDFLNFFAEKFSEKIDSKQSQILKTNDHNIGIKEKRQFFR
jgi:hypothetical protein